MSTVSDSFWPSEIQPSILPPLDLLRPRAEEITAISNGKLIGQVSTETHEDWQYHNLDVVVPALRNLRQRLCVVKHRAALYYPAYVYAKEWQVVLPLIDPNLFGERVPLKNEAACEMELATLLKRVLHSHDVKSILASLIAHTNEVIHGSPDVAIAGVKHGADGSRISYFRIHLPVDGSYGAAVTDARRESIIDMLEKEHKRVVTIRKQDGRYAVNAEVRLTPNRFLRIDQEDVDSDDLGNLPEIGQVLARM